MKAYFHIGHHKTGTSSLQAFLSLNSPTLLRHRILYPWVETQGAAMALADAVAGRGRGARLASVLMHRLRGRNLPDRDDARRDILPFNVREAHNALAFRVLSDTVGWKVPPYHRDLPHSRQMFLAIRQQIGQLRPQHVVFCSEVMSHFGPSAPDQIPRLREAMGPRLAPEDITLWCTLRRPDQQAMSWHGQMIRFGQAPAPLSTPEGLNLSWLHFDYRAVVQPWLNRLEGCRVMLRPYDVTMAAGGSVGDFVTHSGIPFPRGLVPAPTMNVSLPPAAMALLRLANRNLPADQAQAFATQLTPLVKRMRLPSSGEVEMLGRTNRERLFAAFAPIHDWLSQTAGQGPFFSDLDKMLVCKPISEADALADLLTRLRGDLDQFSQPELRDFLSKQIATGPETAQA